MTGFVEGVRRQGRQRICWFDNIQAWTGLSGTALLTATRDRLYSTALTHLCSQPSRFAFLSPFGDLGATYYDHSPNHRVISPNLVAFGTDYLKVVEHTPILLAAEMWAKKSSFGDISFMAILAGDHPSESVK